MSLIEFLEKEVEEEVNKTPEAVFSRFLEALEGYNANKEREQAYAVLICEKNRAKHRYIQNKLEFLRRVRRRWDDPKKGGWSVIEQVRDYAYTNRRQYYMTECTCGTCDPNHNSQTYRYKEIYKW